MWDSINFKFCLFFSDSVKAASELSSSIEDEVVHFAVNASNSLEKLWNAEKAADVSYLYYVYHIM